MNFHKVAQEKSIHTTEPKFVPNEAIEISLNDEIKFKVRMVDCVGYIVKELLDILRRKTLKWFIHLGMIMKSLLKMHAEIGTRKSNSRPFNNRSCNNN